MDLRKNDARYLGHIERWFNVLLPKMAPYLYHRGGPILMTQVCYCVQQERSAAVLHRP